MLMQETEVRSSAGQHVRSHSSKNMAVFLKCVRLQLRYVRPQKSTASLLGVRARTQMRDGRTQMREVLVHRLVRCSHTNARTSWNRWQCVRPQALRSTALSAPNMSRN
jgi:hypothetical protein